MHGSADGAGSGDQRELRSLNRTLRWCRDALAFASDVRHAKEVIDELGLTRSKSATSPLVVDNTSGNESLGQSAPPRRCGEAVVPTELGEARVSRPRSDGLAGASDSHNVIDHPRRRGHSVAWKQNGLRGMWLQEAIVVKKLTLVKVLVALNPADVCTEALFGEPDSRAVSPCLRSPLSL